MIDTAGAVLIDGIYVVNNYLLTSLWPIRAIYIGSVAEQIT